MAFPALSDEQVQNLYQASFEQSAAGLAVLLVDTRIVMVNQNLCDMLGYSEEELLGLTFEALSYPEELDASRSIRSEMVGGARPSAAIEKRYRRKDGSAMWARVVAGSVREAEDQPFCFVVTLIDIGEVKRAQQAVLDNQRWLEKSQRVAGLGHYVFDIQKDWWDGSQMLYEVLGISANGQRDFQGWLQTVHPLDRESMSRYFAEDVLGKHEPFDRDYRVLRASDGAERWVHGSGTVEWSEAGKPISMFGVIEDITERKRADVEQVFFASLFEHMQEGVYLVRMVDGIIVSTNPAFDDMFGYAPGEMAGQPASIVNAPTDKTPEETANEILADLRRTGVWAGDVLNQRKDGTPFWSEAVVSTFEHPDHGTVLLAMHRDITERKAANELLAESEDKFRYVFDHSPVAKSLTKPTGEIDVNDAFLEMVGYTRDELAEGTTWQSMTHPDDVAETNRIVASILAGEQTSARFGKRYLRKDGSVVWADVSTTLRRDVNGEPEYFMTVVIDITERKKAEDEVRRLNAELEQRVLDRTAQLEVANKELEAFSYSVSHDLRAPLRHISGFSSLLLQRADDGMDEKSRHYVERIATAVDDMGVLIDDLLTFSRSGRTELQVADVDMERVLAEALGPVREETSDRDITWTIGPLPHVQGDEALLRQVWSNLLGNAAKFSRTRSPACIEIGALKSDNELRANAASEDVFFVRDNGVGFDMAYADKLFGVFQRLHRASEYEGTGIGLANVQRIVHRHGGRVWAEAELDHGATFYFALPKRWE